MPILTLVGTTHLPPERMHHQLQTVADAKYRYAHSEYARVGRGSILVVNRRRPARQHDAHRRVASDFLKSGVAGKNDRKDSLFADAARNQLRILRSEVEDDD